MKTINSITMWLTLALAIITAAAALSGATHQWAMAAVCLTISLSHGLQNSLKTLKEKLQR